MKSWIPGHLKWKKDEEIPVQNTYRNAREAFRAKPFAAGYAREQKQQTGKQSFSSLQKGSQLAAKTSEGLPYGAGDRVRHVKFGEGTVLDVKEGGRGL